MMEEVKFRFWSEKRKEMHGPYTLDSILLGAIEYSLLTCIQNRDCKALQYTGKKDKSGTEIYHKDVLLIEEEDEEPVESTVEWTDIGWSVDGSWLSDLSQHAKVMRSSYEQRKGRHH